MDEQPLPCRAWEELGAAPAIGSSVEELESLELTAPPTAPTAMMEAIPLGPMPPELAAAQALPIMGLQVRLQSSAGLPSRLQHGAWHASEGTDVQSEGIGLQGAP